MTTNPSNSTRPESHPVDPQHPSRPAGAPSTGRAAPAGETGTADQRKLYDRATNDAAERVQQIIDDLRKTPDTVAKNQREWFINAMAALKEHLVGIGRSESSPVPPVPVYEVMPGPFR